MKSISRIAKTLLGGGLGLLLAFALADANPALAQAGMWETKAPMPNIRAFGFAGVIDGKLHAGGGGGAEPLGNPINNEHYEYDPATDTWTLRAPIPTRRGGASAVVNRKIYVVGGCLSDCRINTTNLLEAYDPDDDSWSTLPPMPTARVGHAAAALNGKLFVVGGVPACLPCLPQLRSIEVYDPVFNTWDTTTTRAPMPTGREGASAAVIDGKLYVVGGVVRNPGNAFDHHKTGTLEVYDPGSDTWDTTRAPMPTPRQAASVGVIGGKLHVVGGVADAGITATHEVYDPLTDSWSTLEPMPTARWVAMTGVIDGRLYVAGGGGVSEALDILEVFTSEPAVLEVAVDIKPQSCPNPLNVKSKGVLPVAILGTADLDVIDIELVSLTLEGVAPLRASLEDVAAPFEPLTGKDDAFDCTDAGADGFADLTLKFDRQDVIAAAEAAFDGPFENGDFAALHLEGALRDGTPIIGEDVVLFLKKGKK